MGELFTYSHPTTTAHTVQSEVQSAVTLLEKSLFVKASELLDKVTVAAKDTSGRIRWVTLSSTYHSILVRTAIAAVKANGPKHSVASIKEALFIFLLDILNGKPQQGFFSQPNQEHTREYQKQVRPARKQNQASSREVDTHPPPPLLPTPRLHSPGPLSPLDEPILLTPSKDTQTSKPKPNLPPLVPPLPSPTPVNVGPLPSSMQDAPMSPEQLEVEELIMQDLQEIALITQMRETQEREDRQKISTNTANKPKVSQPEVRKADTHTEYMTRAKTKAYRTSQHAKK
jgi:hypothetical protein